MTQKRKSETITLKKFWEHHDFLFPFSSTFSCLSAKITNIEI